MPAYIQEKIHPVGGSSSFGAGQLLTTTAALGGVGLLIAENEKGYREAFEKAREQLLNNNYKECYDYLEIMEVLAEGKDKLFYVEVGEKLDGLVLEIIAEFEAGMVNLADRKHNTGLKTAMWNPTKTSCIVIMSRQQVEASYHRLFEYINFTGIL